MVIYVTSRNGHELATAQLSVFPSCDNAKPSCGFKVLL
jgi:hypothetical protein